MGRQRSWTERINLTLPEGARARMDAVLEADEDRLDLIRTAIDREVKRRQRRKLARRLDGAAALDRLRCGRPADAAAQADAPQRIGMTPLTSG